METNQQSQISKSNVIVRQTQSLILPQSLDSKFNQSSYYSYQTHISNTTYDSTYRNGFPKLYTWDDTIRNSKNLSASKADKSKFSFKELQGSKVNESLKRENQYLRSEVNRLNSLLEIEKRNTKQTSSSNAQKSQIDRLTIIIQKKTTQIYTLEQRLLVIEKQRSQWLYKYQQTQRVIRELNTQIIQYRSQTTRLQQSIILIQNQQQRPSQKIVQKVVQKIVQKPVQKIVQKPVEKIVYKQSQQVETLRKQIQSYKSQISTLKSSINANSTFKSVSNQEVNQYEYQLSQYKSQFSVYQRKIKQLQQSNWELQQTIQKNSKISTEKGQNNASNLQKGQTKKKTQNQSNDQEFILERGKLTLRIIILLEEINRLKQRQLQLDQKAVQLHRYLLRAENYIEEVQAQLQKNNLKENIPVHIVEKITILQEQIQVYKVQIEQLKTRNLSNQNQIDQETHVAMIGQRDLKIIVLLQEITRLNEKVTEVRSYLQRAEDYIEQMQNSISQKQYIVPPQVQNQIGLLSQQNNRLNEIIQSYISQIRAFQLRIKQFQSKTVISNTQVKVEFKIPPQVQAKIAFLAQQNQRLTRLIKQEQTKTSKIQYRTQTKVQFKIPPQMQARIAFLAQQNQRLTRLIQQLERRSSKVQQKVQIKVEYRVPPQVQAEIAFLAQQNVRLSQHISSLNISQRSQKVDFQQIAVQLGKKDMKSIMLLQEINRLNFSLSEVRGYLVKAQNYIQEIEKVRNQPNIPQQLLIQLNQLRQQVTILGSSSNSKTNTQIQTKIAFLAQQNQRLSSIIRQMESEIIGYRNKPSVDTSSYQTKIASLSQQNSRLTITINGLQNNLKQLNTRSVSNNSESEAYQIQKGKLILKTLILLQQINRLNHTYLQLRDHLIHAENYIEDVQKKLIAQDQTIPTQLQNQIAFLRQQHERLTQYIQTIQIKHRQQINVLNVQITTLSSRPTEIKERQVVKQVVKQVFKISPQIQAKIAFLGQQNQRLNALVQKLSSIAQSNQTSNISSLEVKIRQLTERDSFFTRQNQQLKQFLGRAELYIQQNEAKWAQTQNVNSVEQYQILLQQKTALWAQNQLRGFILLEEINRLNHKLLGLQSVHIQVIQHLKQAEAYIRELEQKSVMQASSSTISSSNVNLQLKIQELTSQILNLDSQNTVQIASKSLQIIILLEQINRLNHKQKELSSKIKQSSSHTQEASISQITILKRKKEECQAELTDVIQHLRNAEHFIEQISRDKVQIENERAFLISELNRLQFQLQKRS